MSKDVDLIQYLPLFVAEYKEIQQIMNTENPEFNLLENEAEKVQNNQYIISCDENGISRFEKLLNIVPLPDDTLDSRKSRCLMRWNETVPYTYRTLINELNLLCDGDFAIKSDFGEYEIRVTTHLREYGRVEEVRTLLNEMIPANMLVIIFNITAINADGAATVYTGIKLSGKHRKIRTEVKNYGLE